MKSVNYLLLFKGNSSQGGYESSVRGFSEQKAARTAMTESCRKLAAGMGLRTGSDTFWDRYTTRTQTGIRLEWNGSWFQWEIVDAVPEDGDSAGPGVPSQNGPCEYTVTIEEHISQEFSIKAYDIFCAMDAAMQKYKQGELVVQPAAPTARLIMARDNKTGDLTEWKEF